MPAATVEALLAPVFRGEQSLEPVYDPAPIADATPPELLAEGYPVTVCLAGAARRIIVNAAGRVRVESTGC